MVELHVASYVRRLRVRYHGATYVAALGLDHRMGWLAMASLGSVMFSISMHVIDTRWTLRADAMPTVDKYLEGVIAVIIAPVVQDTLLDLTNRSSPMGILGLVLGLVYRFRRSVPRRVISTMVLLWLVLVAILQLTYGIKEVAEIQRGVCRPWDYRWQGSSSIGKGSGKENVSSRVKPATHRGAWPRRFMAAGEAEGCRCADDPWYHGMAAHGFPRPRSDEVPLSTVLELL